MDISLLFPLLILLLFIPIFLSGRKQRRQMAEMQNLQKSLEPGDWVITTSGVRGEIVDTEHEDTIDIEIAPGVVTTWIRAAVREKVALPVEEPTAEVPAPAVEESAPAAEEKPEPADGISLDKNSDSTNGATRS